ncbi:MAG: ATP synthase F0 subunit B [Polyangia bacterium]
MLVALILARAEEASPPLIDLDGTTFVQLGIFLVMLLVLSRTLFGPYLKMRADRERGIAGSRREAESMGGKARHIVEDYDRKLADAKRRGNDERNKLRQEGVAHEREVVGKARAEIQKAVEASTQKIAADTATGRTALAAEAAPLARKVASRILGREIT